jgi:hypothetical protein
MLVEVEAGGLALIVALVGLAAEFTGKDVIEAGAISFF